MRRAGPALTAAVALLAAAAAQAQAPARAALTEETLDAQRGGLATPLGVDIGFGASVRTYVDGSLALETRMTWTPDGVQTERVFESEAAKGLTAAQAGAGPAGMVTVLPGTSVLHDLSENRIASVVLNTGDNRSIRQDTDLSLHLPQLPDLQQRIAAERLAQSLQAISPQAAGLGQ